jgi:hypothetical protein
MDVSRGGGWEIDLIKEADNAARPISLPPETHPIARLPSFTHTPRSRPFSTPTRKTSLLGSDLSSASRKELGWLSEESREGVSGSGLSKFFFYLYFQDIIRIQL